MKFLFSTLVKNAPSFSKIGREYFSAGIGNSISRNRFFSTAVAMSGSALLGYTIYQKKNHNADSRGLMVLVEGLDLAGKSTLAKALTKHFHEQGIQVSFSRNALVPHNTIAQHADALRRETSAGLLETGALFLAAHERDINTFTYPQPGQIHIQDSCWLRTLAFHTLYQTRFIPKLVKESSLRQPAFDVVLYLTAGVEVRQHRVKKREKELPGENDKADYLVCTDPEKFKQNDALLLAKTKEIYPHCMVIDTTQLTEKEVFNKALMQIKPSFNIHTSNNKISLSR